jgi:hypothetical protein
MGTTWVADDHMSALGSRDNIENLSQRRELSDAAKALLADKAFGHAYLELRQLWFGQIMDLPHASPMQDELAARLRALDAIPNELGRILDNYRIDARSARNA